MADRQGYGWPVDRGDGLPPPAYQQQHYSGHPVYQQQQYYYPPQQNYPPHYAQAMHPQAMYQQPAFQHHQGYYRPQGQVGRPSPVNSGGVGYVQAPARQAQIYQQPMARETAVPQQYYQPQHWEPQQQQQQQQQLQLQLQLQQLQPQQQQQIAQQQLLQQQEYELQRQVLEQKEQIKAHAEQPEQPEQQEQLLQAREPQKQPQTSPVKEGQQEDEVNDNSERCSLLNLSNEYILEARRLGQGLSSGDEDRAQVYARLMALGLGCLETAFKIGHGAIDPVQDAHIMLRLAALMIEETRNFAQLEALLYSCIEFCKRHRLHSQRYEATFLLVQALSQTKPKLAEGLIEKTVKNIEQDGCIAWAYVFQFQKVKLILNNPLRNKTAVKELQQVQNLSSHHGDIHVTHFSLVFQASLLMKKGNAESIMDARQIIATAHSLVPDPYQALPEEQGLYAWLALIDLGLSMSSKSIQECRHKLNSLQKLMDHFNSTGEKPASDTFFFVVPLTSTTIQRSNVECSRAGFHIYDEAKYGLKFQWLDWTSTYVMGYLFSSLAISLWDPKAELILAHLDAGLGAIEKPLASASIRDMPLSKLQQLLGSRNAIKCYVLQNLALSQCRSNNYDAALNTVQGLRQYMEALPLISEELSISVQLLYGFLHQGQGKLETALHYFESIHLPSAPIDLQSLASKIAVTALISRGFILQLLNRNEARKLLAELEPLFTETTPIEADICALKSAFRLLEGVITTSQMHKRQYLHDALGLAKEIQNTQLISMGISLLFSSFHEGTVGKESAQTARVALLNADKAGDRLWMAITRNVSADLAEREGRHEEAMHLRAEADGGLSKLSEEARARLS